MVTQELNVQNVNAMPRGERLVSAGLLSDRDRERARLAQRDPRELEKSYAHARSSETTPVQPERHDCLGYTSDAADDA